MLACKRRKARKFRWHQGIKALTRGGLAIKEFRSECPVSVKSKGVKYAPPVKKVPRKIWELGVVISHEIRGVGAKCSWKHQGIAAFI